MLTVMIHSGDADIEGALSSGARSVGATVLPWRDHTDALPRAAPLLVLTDADASGVTRLAADLRAEGLEPRRLLVRLLPAQPTGWVYHDLPVFASILAPRSESEAASSILRLIRARQVEVAPADAGCRLGADPAPIWKEVDRLVALSAPTDLKILFAGETGTGKNTLARRVHEASGRTGPFVAVNCAALPETLIESELFGVEPGAFTGAARARPGKFELADRGTLFIDEIDSLPLHLQVKLLGAIQDQGTTRLGDHRFKPSSFRLITATQTCLRMLVAEGRFRADLMHRVSVVEIRLPSVRDLGSEIVATFEAMVTSEAARLGVQARPIEPAVYATLFAHDWPGNFRELHAAAQRYAIGLPLVSTGADAATTASDLRTQVAEFERVLVSRALGKCNGELRVASRMLRLPLETLRYKIRQLGLHNGTRRAGASSGQSDSLGERMPASVVPGFWSSPAGASDRGEACGGSNFSALSERPDY